MRRTSWGEKESPKPVPSALRRRAVVSCPLSPLLRLAVFYLLLLTIHTGLFVYQHGDGFWAIVVSVPAGFLFGLLLHFFGRGISRIRERMLAVMGPILAGFLLLFLFLLGYILIFSVVVSLPVEWCINVQTGSVQLARQYVLYSMNLVIVLAILSWLRWLVHVVGLYHRQVE